jgi:hypothetical protein
MDDRSESREQGKYAHGEKKHWTRPRLQIIAGREAEANFAVYGGIDGGFYHS